MAILLNLETATTNCSVSVSRDGELLAIKEYNNAGYSHSEQLHNFIAQAVSEASISLSNVDAIAVSKGPGSYTGLRIGVSAAKGLCFALDIPLIAVSTLESMAHQVKVKSGDCIIPVLDARRMEVYAAVFDSEHRQIRDTKAEIIDVHSFDAWTSKGQVHVVGSGAAKCKGLLEKPNFVFDTTVIPSARQMAALSFKKYTDKAFEDVAYFEPFYLKDFVLQQKK